MESRLFTHTPGHLPPNFIVAVTIAMKILHVLYFLVTQDGGGVTSLPCAPTSSLTHRRPGYPSGFPILDGLAVASFGVVISLGQALSQATWLSVEVLFLLPTPPTLVLGSRYVGRVVTLDTAL